jgi:hypothetical protein
MDKSVLALTNGLSPGLGFAIMVGLGVFLLALRSGRSAIRDGIRLAAKGGFSRRCLPR